MMEKAQHLGVSADIAQHTLRLSRDLLPGVQRALRGGFSQILPEQGPPHKLAEDKLYVARIVGGKNSQTAEFFEIRNGKPINVTDKVFGP